MKVRTTLLTAQKRSLTLVRVRRRGTAVSSTIAILALCALPLSLPGQAPAAKPWTVDDVLAMKSVGGVAISPDGKRVAYVVTTSDREADVNRSDIWIVSTDGGTPVQVTYGPRANRAPQWVADGSWLAFLSDRAEKGRMQVYGIDPSGGEAWPVTKHETSVSDFEISPNGERVAFLATAPEPSADKDLEKERGRPMVRDSAYASDWTRVWTADLVNRTAGIVRPSSPDSLDVTSVVWAPDSRVLAWSANPSPVLRTYEMGNVFVQSEGGAEARQVTHLEGGVDVVGWPEGLGLIVAASGKLHSTANQRLWVVPITGTDPVPLTDALDEDARYVAANATELLVEAAVGTSRALFRIPLAAGQAAGPPQRISDSAYFYSGFSAAIAGRSMAPGSKPAARTRGAQSQGAPKAAAPVTGDMIAFLAESPSQPPDVHASSIATFSPRRLTSVNPQATTFAYGAQRVVRWNSKADSEAIEGILTLPVGYEAGKKVPLLLVIHGGPSGVSSNRYPPMRGAYPVTVFASLGYAVLQPNYRGSAGYGQRFRGLNVGDISGNDWVDVNSGVDALIRMGIVDSTKMGIMGWSFGGHHTYWGITHTPRFSAASAGAGANDLISMYSETDIPEFYQTYLGPRPWENFDLYEQRSAFRFVKNVSTPLLIQVGQADRRVPAEQSIEFYEAVKEIGKVPVKLVMYPGQPHGISDPRLNRDLMQRNVEWFTHWVPVTGQKPPVRVDGGMP